jgi:hypothetical protein
MDAFDLEEIKPFKKYFCVSVHFLNPCNPFGIVQQDKNEKGGKIQKSLIDLINVGIQIVCRKDTDPMLILVVYGNTSNLNIIR